ncbi:sulfonate transport system substrate-binding protein [Bradyrhizobium japonicum]|nr:sulfonate transport system substrate-binding protein [Bradyrhizobium japonicum]MCS3961467.1 sulfonate transport system substrate-binding protein [Bradyrhizobium japonicum]MCS3993783.1 sulfonate transport system substrate-binding protein [Bradyrhizobium japonicum]
MQRRDFLKLSVGTAAAAAFTSRANAQGAVKEIRIGYQKNGVLIITRQQAALEKHFIPQGIEVKWVEFSSGPPMMEAMNVGSVDYGAVGDSPPVFAQAAGAAIVYAAGQPITNGQGILVPKDSPIRSIADLKGKRIGFTKGSSAHNVVVQTLEKAGLTYADITPVYLTPPDAGPAFANGSIEAWAIWDPYFAIGETKQNGRILINAREVTKTNSFYIANREFAKTHGAILQQIVDVTTATGKWAEQHRGEVAKWLAAVTGVPLDIQTVAADRANFVVGPVTDDIVVTQQGVADRFYKLGLIPKPIVVRDIVWRNPAAHRADHSSHAQGFEHEAYHSASDRGHRAVDRYRRRRGRHVLRPGQARQGGPHRLPEIRQAGAAQEQGHAGAEARRQRLQGGVDRIPVRPAAARSAQCRRDRFRQHR